MKFWKAACFVTQLQIITEASARIELSSFETNIKEAWKCVNSDALIIFLTALEN
jgi:hypothetical protein